MPEHIEAQRLFLRPPQMEDASAMFMGWATDVENIASQRVLEKVGVSCEGVLRKYIIHPNISDIPRDSYLHAVTR